MKWFEIILVSLTLISGFIWLVDSLFFAKKRKAQSSLLSENELPVAVDYSRSFFPVLAAVLIIRSFIAEPYKIPSSSMMPNLLIGDFILVNKFTYGLRLPINNHKFITLNEPKRGDVVVFKPPHEPEQNWIKRVVGLPGDKIGFEGDTLFINDQAVKYEKIDSHIEMNHYGEPFEVSKLRETFPENTSHIVNEILGKSEISTKQEWTVPAGKYFVMGDNRDNSLDSRFWKQTHFLPEENLRGKAFLVWLNCRGWFCKDGFNSSRIGEPIK